MARDPSATMPWGWLALLGLSALALRVGAALVVGDPAYLDAAYYELVARQLASGEGFTVPVIWSFLEVGGRMPAEATLPVPSNRHWMPLTAVVSAGSMALFGANRLAAELPHALLGAALVPMTSAIGWWLWRSRPVAVVSGVLALFAGPMLVYVPMVDSFALFGVLGAGAIGFATLATIRVSGGRWLVLSGLMIGLATLTRVDGALLAVAPATAWLARKTAADRGLPPIGLGWAVLSAGVGLAVLAPWLARQAAEFGVVLPSAGGRLLWIGSYNEQFSITGDPTLAGYLSESGIGAVGLRLETAFILIGRTMVLLGGAFIATFALGLIRGWARVELRPFIAYWLVLFAAMVLVFTVHAPAGAYYHSAWAWLPFAVPLAVANGVPLLRVLGRRVAILRRERNVRFLAASAIAGAVVLSLVGSAALLTGWQDEQERVRSAAAYLDAEAGSGDVVMYVDPPSLNLLTGLRVVAPPFDDLETIHRVARAYGVRWVVVERARGAATDPLALWDGASWLEANPSWMGTDILIYEVRNGS